MLMLPANARDRARTATQAFLQPPILRRGDHAEKIYFQWDARAAEMDFLPSIFFTTIKSLKFDSRGVGLAIIYPTKKRAPSSDNGRRS